MRCAGQRPNTIPPSSPSPAPNLIDISSGDHRARLLKRRDELVESHMDLVPPIAARIHKSCPSTFLLEDLIATGNLALLHMALRYRPQAHAGTPFSAYARPGIRGAILDSIRRRHWKECTRVTYADPPEAAHVVTMWGGEEAGEIEITLDQKRLTERVAAAIRGLSPLQATILNVYYSADSPSLRDVAEKLGIPEGQVAKERAAAIAELRARLCA